MSITLNSDDPVIFAKCGGNCCKSWPGKKVGDYFAKAYTERRWRHGPVCDNCGSPMVKIYEIERD